MDTRRLFAAAAFVAALAGCGPKDYSTAYNLDFEYTLKNKLPTQWGVPDLAFHGYVSSLDFDQRQHGTAALRMEQVDSSRTGWAGFWQSLPSELVAGHEIELSGWIRTQDVNEGFADFYLADEETNYSTFPPDTANRGVRNTTQWTRISLKKRIGKDIQDVEIGGILKGSGIAWFDNMELTIDGEKYRDTLIPAPKNRLTREDKKELRKYTYPIRSCDPGKGGSDDLRVLNALIGDSKVVALGENTHGASKIYRMKHRIIEYMAENMGFDIFSIEANMPESYRLNQYTVDGKGDPKNLIAGMYFWTWNTQEMLDLVEWMRNFNQAGHRITYTGFDMQFYEESVSLLDAAFTNDEQSMQLLWDIYAGLKDVQTYSSSGIPQINAPTAKNIAEKLVRIERQIGKLSVAEKEKAWLRQNAALLHQFLGDGPLLSWRDRCMAGNLLWIKRQNPLSRIVVWAHNGHIEKSSDRMGGFLQDSLGTEYVNFGFTFYDGEYTGIRPGNNTWRQQAQRAYPGTLEYLLDKLDEPMFILDLKKMREEDSPALAWIDGLRFRHIGAVKVEQEFPDTKTTEKYDYLLFIRNVTPSQLLN